MTNTYYGNVILYITYIKKKSLNKLKKTFFQPLLGFR